MPSAPGTYIQHWDYTVHNTECTLTALLYGSILFTPANKIVSCRLAPPFLPSNPLINPGLILNFSRSSPASLLPEAARTMWFDSGSVGRGRIGWRIESYKSWRQTSEPCFIADPLEWLPEADEVNASVLEVYFPDFREACEGPGVENNMVTRVNKMKESGRVISVTRYLEQTDFMEGMRLQLMGLGLRGGEYDRGRRTPPTVRMNSSMAVTVTRTTTTVSSAATDDNREPQLIVSITGGRRRHRSQDSEWEF